MAASHLLRLGTVKGKNGVLNALKHNKRTLQAERGAGANIDPSRTPLNYSLTKPDSAEAIDRHAKVLMVQAGIDQPRVNQVMAVEIMYRPFSRQWAYFNKNFNEDTRQMPRIFPDTTTGNRVICVTGVGVTKDFCAFISDTLPDLEMISKGQCFPLKLYEKNSAHGESIKSDDVHGELFEDDQPSESIITDAEYTVKDGITDAGLAHFQSAYPTEAINKEDVFYYIYGLLHSEDYKKRYADNLNKELPRIPCVKKASDFWSFSKAGSDFAELHINYEPVILISVVYIFLRGCEHEYTQKNTVNAT